MNANIINIYTPINKISTKYQTVFQNNLFFNFFVFFVVDVTKKMNCVSNCYPTNSAYWSISIELQIKVVFLVYFLIQMISRNVAHIFTCENSSNYLRTSSSWHGTNGLGTFENRLSFILHSWSITILYLLSSFTKIPYLMVLFVYSYERE